MPHSYLSISALRISAYIFIFDKYICSAWSGVTQKSGRGRKRMVQKLDKTLAFLLTVPSNLSLGSTEGKNITVLKIEVEV